MPKHSERRTLPYSAQQMYDLVADVAAYPQFLPWTAAARIRSRRPITGAAGQAGEAMEADLVISFKLFRERFGSLVELWPAEHRIDTRYIDGPFKHMTSTWAFSDQGGGGAGLPGGVRCGFRISQCDPAGHHRCGVQRSDAAGGPGL